MAIPYKLRTGNTDIPMRKPVFTIGSQEKFSDLTINNPEIAPIHANISLTPEGIWMIRDFNTKLGTKVNDSFIEANTDIELKDGDLIEIGQNVITFENNIKQIFFDEDLTTLNELYRTLQCAESEMEIDEANAQILRLLQEKAEISKRADTQKKVELQEDIEILRQLRGEDLVEDQEEGEPVHPRPEIHQDRTPSVESERENTVEGYGNKISHFFKDFLGIKPKDEGEDDVHSAFISHIELERENVKEEALPKQILKHEDDTELIDIPDAFLPKDETEEEIVQADNEADGIVLLPLEDGIPMIDAKFFPYHIGRDEGCDTVLSVRGISRVHAKILTDNTGNFILKDNHSTNGTYVNKQKVEDQMILKPGDEVSFYNVEYMVDES